MINFEINSILYGSGAPAAFVQYSALNSMLAFLLLAVLSFLAAWITRRSTKEKVPEEKQSVMPEPQHEAQTEDETQTEETEP